MQMKQHRTRLQSRYIDGSLIYPGEYDLIYVLIGSVRFLVAMKPVEVAA
jgi:hypothetical protein